MSTELKSLSDYDQTEIDNYMLKLQEEEEFVDLEYDDFISSLSPNELSEGVSQQQQQQPPPPSSVPTGSGVSAPSRPQHPDEYLFDLQGNLIQAPSQEAFLNWPVSFGQFAEHNPYFVPYQYPQPITSSYECYPQDHLDQMMGKMSMYPVYGNNNVPNTVEQPGPMCKFFPNCRYGNSCKFYHPYPVTGNGGVKTSENAGPFNDDRGNAPRSFTSSRAHVPLHKQTCRYFPNCTYGDACIFYHPTFTFTAQNEHPKDSHSASE